MSGVGAESPTALQQYAGAILAALDAALLDEVSCAQFMADPTTPQDFLHILHQVQAQPDEAMVASSCFMRLCMLEGDTQGSQGPYCRFVVQSDIAEPITKCILKAMQVRHSGCCRLSKSVRG